MNADNGFVFTSNYYEQNGSNEQDVVGNFNQFNSSYTFQQSGDINIFNAELEDGSVAAEESLYLDRSMLLHTMSPLLAAVTKRDAESQSYLNQHLEKAVSDAVESNFRAPTSNIECNIISDCPVLCRAKASLPKDYLVFGDGDSNVTRDHSVFVQRFIAHPTKFGPYAGEAVYASELDLDVLQVQTPRHYPLLILDSTHILDVSNENKSNWMRYVRLATNELERNLSLQLDKGKIFLRTTRPLNVGDELCVGHWLCGECNRDFVQPNELHTHLLLEHQLDTDVANANDGSSHTAAQRARSQRSQRKLRPRVAKTVNAPPTVSDDLSIRCHTCHKLFMTNYSLRQHMQRQHTHSQSRCRKRALPHHLTASKRRRKGNIEFMAFKSLAGKLAVTGTRACHKCNLCAKRFCSVERLQTHKQSRHATQTAKPHTCVVCAQQCATRTALVAHLQSHAPASSYTCVYCDQQFNYVRHFKAHVSSHCDAVDGLYHCQHCQRTYTAYHLVRKHVRIFHSARQFNCQQCSKTFPSLNGLQRHRQTHSSHKQHECGICTRAFLRRDQLVAHTRRVHATSHHATTTTTPEIVEANQDKHPVDLAPVASIAAAPMTESAPSTQSPASRLDVLQDECLNRSCPSEGLQASFVECVLSQEPESTNPAEMPPSPPAIHLDDKCEQSSAVESPAANNETTDTAMPVAIDVPPPTTMTADLPAPSGQFTSPLYPYKCHLCSGANVSFKRRGILVNHFIKHHPHVNLATVKVLNTPLTKPLLEFLCPCCCKIYKSNAKRKAHISKHHPTYKQNAADSTSKLLMVGSLAVEIHKCDLCPRQYAARNRLVAHYRKMHPNSKLRSSGKSTTATVVPAAVGNDDVEGEAAALFLNDAVTPGGTLLTDDVGVSIVSSCGSVANCVDDAPFLEPEINITENKLLKLSSAALELSRFDFLNERNSIVVGGDELSRFSATLFDNVCSNTTTDAFVNKVDYKTLFT